MSVVNGFTRRRWPLIIIAVLTAQAAGIISMVVVSGRDPSFAVEPDYYQKALAWDDAARRQQAGAALGWTMEVGAASDGLTLVLKDALGRPLEGAQVEAQVFHHARAGDRQVVALAAAGAGAYSAAHAMRDGLWEVRLTITRGPEVLTVKRQVQVGAVQGRGEAGGREH